MTDMTYQLASTRHGELLREAAARRGAVEAVATRSLDSRRSSLRLRRLVRLAAPRPAVR